MKNTARSSHVRDGGIGLARGRGSAEEHHGMKKVQSPACPAGLLYLAVGDGKGVYLRPWGAAAGLEEASVMTAASAAGSVEEPGCVNKRDKPLDGEEAEEADC